MQQRSIDGLQPIRPVTEGGEGSLLPEVKADGIFVNQIRSDHMTSFPATPG